MRISRRATVWAGAVTIGVLARTVEIGRWPGLNGDEAWYGVNVQEFLSGGMPFLRTPPGNLLSPLHSGVLLMLSTVFDASVALLRMPEILFGVLAVITAYPLLRAPLGKGTALVAAVLFALSPTAVAYARIGWDPSGTPLITLLAIGAALHDRPLITLLVAILALLVHPTNVFAFPVVAAAWAPHGIARYRGLSAARRRKVAQALAAGVLVAVPVGAWGVFQIAANPGTPLPSVGMAIERVLSPSLWLTHAWGATALVSGGTPLHYIAGPLPGLLEAIATASVVIGFVACVAMPEHWRADHHAAWLIAGVALSFAAFHIVAVPAAFHPGFERYALFLLTPTLLIVAVGLDALARKWPAAGTVATIATAAAMLAVTAGGYFQPFVRQGGASDQTFRTGAVEPKLAALRFIEHDSENTRAVRIVADDWWLYWSLRYFAGINGRFYVEPGPSALIPGGTHPPSVAPPSVPDFERTYRVSFAAGGSSAMSSAVRFAATDPQGRPIVEVRLLADQNLP